MKNQDSKAIEKMVNSFDWKAIEVGVELTTMHPYLQEQFFCALLHFVCQQARKEETCFDSRNEFTGKCCKAIYKALVKEKLYSLSSTMKNKYDEILKQA